MDLTDRFTWEVLPTTDADTGHLTAAGWIPRIINYTWFAAIAIISLHLGQSTIRIVTKHETIIASWYPFDWTVSPFYELVNISQVTISKTAKLFTSSYNILNLKGWVNWLPSFSFSLFLSLISHEGAQLQSVGHLTDREREKKISMRSSWSNRGNVPEFLCRNNRKNEKILDIRCFNCTQRIHIHSTI